jgi:hypothetical protein
VVGLEEGGTDVCLHSLGGAGIDSRERRAHDV